MKEHLLHYIWRNKLFNVKALTTTVCANLEIIDFGSYNKDGGPDFLNAKIRIDDVILAGNIELHVKASDWKLHKHDADKKYANIILHVVYFDDMETGLPTLELNGRIPPLLLQKYIHLMSAEGELACANQLNSIDSFTLHNWTERLVIERLERKSKIIRHTFSVNHNDWQETTYQLFGKYFGAPVNKASFESLTALLPYKIISRHSSGLFQLESLLFGVAGMLDRDFTDSYPISLKKEFSFLRYKYQLRSLDSHQWQFLRMRPISFPTIRLSLFSALLQRTPLFERILQPSSTHEFLEEIEVSPYWNSHYLFDKPSLIKPKLLGKVLGNSLRINVVAPLIYTYGVIHAERKYMEQALALLAAIPAEQNARIQIFTTAHWFPESAYSTQAMLELNEYYCTRKRCLDCAIGNKIL